MKSKSFKAWGIVFLVFSVLFIALAVTSAFKPAGFGAFLINFYEEFTYELTTINNAELFSKLLKFSYIAAAITLLLGIIFLVVAKNKKKKEEKKALITRATASTTENKKTVEVITTNKKETKTMRKRVEKRAKKVKKVAEVVEAAAEKVEVVAEKIVEAPRKTDNEKLASFLDAFRQGR